MAATRSVVEATDIAYFATVAGVGVGVDRCTDISGTDARIVVVATVEAALSILTRAVGWSWRSAHVMTNQYARGETYPLPLGTAHETPRAPQLFTSLVETQARVAGFQMEPDGQP